MDGFKFNTRFIFAFVAMLCLSMMAMAQSSSHQYVTVVAEPDHADWTYRTGETAHFTAYAIK